MIKINNKECWRLYSMEKPPEDGIYDVKLRHKRSRLGFEEITIMEYKNGKWIMTLSTLIDNFEVIAWKYRNEVSCTMEVYYDLENS